MLKLDSNIGKIKVGDTIKCGRTEYTIVSIFNDRGHEFYVGKYKMKDGVISYSNIFTYSDDNEDGIVELFKHV